MTVKQLNLNALPSRPATILVVEDDPLLRFGLASDLSDAGFHVREAASADEAEVVMRSVAVDLIVTDVEMPGSRDGLGLAHYVRSHFPGLPVIVVSGRSTKSDAAGAADAFFAKPYDITRLIQRVRVLLSARPQGGKTPA